MGLVSLVIRNVIERRLSRVEAALRNPAETQERLLLGLVRFARDTEWGRSHGYGRIRSVRDFQQAVPVNRYEDLAPLWLRAIDGEHDLAWPGHISYFAISSGTTTGDTKLLPISREAIRANFRSGATLVGFCERQAPGSMLGGGKMLYFGGSIKLERRGQCWQGDASGINALKVPRFARRYRLPPPDVAGLGDWEAKVEAICRRCQKSPVFAVSGLPSWTLILFRRLVDLAREQRGAAVSTVSDVWPDLRAFVHFGMAFEPYRQQFRELVGRSIATIDTYSSSESGLNAIQTDQADPSMQLEVDTGAFFEFVPACEIEQAAPPRLTLDEVEPGVDYAVLVSTPSGIWAYDLGDIVRFTSLRPPKLLVVGRTKLALNLVGEHIIQENIERAVTEASEAFGTRVSDFTVAPVLPTAADPRGRHLWLVEFACQPEPPLDAFAARLDTSLCEQSLDYRLHRGHDYSLLGPQVAAVAPGTFYEWARRHGALGGQHKVPRVARSQEMVDELQQLSTDLRQTGRSTKSQITLRQSLELEI